MKQGYGVFVPLRMVPWHGGEAIAWWELNLETGEMIGVGENGTHQFLVIGAAGAILFMQVIRIIFDIVELIARYHVWQHTAEMTWDYFWQDAVGEALDNPDNQTSKEVYLDALQKTKTHMRDTVWPFFGEVWANEAGWLSLIDAEDLK